MDNPKVTAIITTHNRRDLVGRAVESVLAQTYKNLDCIVVDDASDISAEDICTKYPVKFIYIPKDDSSGGNHARNIGIMATDADYVAFLDDDDYWLPEKIEKQITLIAEKRCKFVYSGARAEIIKDGIVTEGKYYPNYLNQGNMSKKILYGICCLNITMLIERQLLVDVGLFDENIRFWQEYELMIRLAQKTTFYFVPEVMAVFRVDIKDTGRLTNKYDDWKKAVDYIYKKHRNLFSALSFMEKERVRINYHNDACNRAKNSGLFFRVLYHNFLMKTRCLPSRIIIKIIDSIKR